MRSCTGSTQQTRALGAHLCGRRLYETMVYWETARSKGLCSTEYELQFAQIWYQLPKVVFSSNPAQGLRETPA